MKKSTKIILLISAGLFSVGVLLVVIGMVVSGGKIGISYNNQGWYATAGLDRGYSGSYDSQQQRFTNPTGLDLSSLGNITLTEDASLPAGTFEVSYYLPSEWRTTVSQQDGVITISSPEAPANFNLFYLPWALHRQNSAYHDSWIKVSYGPGSRVETASVYADIGKISVSGLTVNGAFVLEADLGDATVAKVSAASFSANMNLGDADFSDLSVAQDCYIRNDTGQVTLNQAAASSLTVENNLGLIAAQGCTAQSSSLDTDMGEIELIACSLGDASLSSSMGSITADGCSADSLAADCDMGAITLDGAWAGTTTIHSNMGDINFVTTLELSTYYLDLSVDMGSLSLNGRHIGSPAVQGDSSAPNSVVISAGPASASLSFPS